MPSEHEIRVTSLVENTHVRVEALSDGNCLFNGFYLHLAATFARHGDFRGYDIEHINELLRAVCSTYPILRAKCPTLADGFRHVIDMEQENIQLYQRFIAHFQDWESRQMAMARALRAQVAPVMVHNLPELEPPADDVGAGGITDIADELARDRAHAHEDGYHLGDAAIGTLANLYQVNIHSATGIVHVHQATGERFETLPRGAQENEFDVEVGYTSHRGGAAQHDDTQELILLPTDPQGGAGGHFDILLRKEPGARLGPGQLQAEEFAAAVNQPSPDAPQRRQVKETITQMYRRGNTIAGRFNQRFAQQADAAPKHTPANPLDAASAAAAVASPRAESQVFQVSGNQAVNRYVTDFLGTFDQKRIALQKPQDLDPSSDYQMALRMQLNELDGFLKDKEAEQARAAQAVSPRRGSPVRK